MSKLTAVTFTVALVVITTMLVILFGVLQQGMNEVATCIHTPAVCATSAH